MGSILVTGSVKTIFEISEVLTIAFSKILNPASGFLLAPLMAIRSSRIDLLRVISAASVAAGSGRDA